MGKVTQFGVGIAIMIATAFLLFNAAAIFGDYAETAKTIIVLYVLMTSFFLAAAARKPKILSADFGNLIYFLGGFLITALMVIFIPKAITGSFAVVSVIGFGFLYAFVIAFYEELNFRDILPNSLGVSPLVSNVAFSLFHLSALLLSPFNSSAKAGFIGSFGLPGFLIFGFAILFVLGMAWTYVRARWGLMSAVGSHTAWNFAVYSPATFALLVPIFGG